MSLFTCLKCDKCCYFETEDKGPIVFPDEVERLKTLARLKNVELRFRQVRLEGLEAEVYRWAMNGYCPFYDRARRICEIHPYKPLSCRMYPLLLNVVTKEVVISTECTWVRQMLERGFEITLESFPNEVNALKEVVKRLWGVDVECE